MNHRKAGRLRTAVGLLPLFVMVAGMTGCAPSRVEWRNASPQDEEQWRRQQKLQFQPDCSVTLWGDSILNGGRDITQRSADPPALILRRQRPRYAVEDNSVPGDRAHAREPQFLRLSFRARIVVLQYGINDAGNGHAYERALRAMVAHAQAQGRAVVITGLSRVNGVLPGRDANDAIARRVASDTGSTFADWGSVRFDPADMVDSVHPAAPYAWRLTEQLARALDRVAPECAAPGH